MSHNPLLISTRRPHKSTSSEPEHRRNRKPSKVYDSLEILDTPTPPPGRRRSSIRSDSTKSDSTKSDSNVRYPNTQSASNRAPPPAPAPKYDVRHGRGAITYRRRTFGEENSKRRSPPPAPANSQNSEQTFSHNKPPPNRKQSVFMPSTKRPVGSGVMPLVLQ